MTSYEFLVRLRDQASNGLKRIAQIAGVAENGINRVKRGLQSLGSVSRSVYKGLASVGKMVAGALVTMATTGFMAIMKMSHNAREEYLKTKTLISNSLKSESAGGAAMSILDGFAKNAPHKIEDITEGFKKLVIDGLVPTKKQMIQIGDLAIFRGKTFEQFTDAMIMAEKGKFTQLEQFGIKTEKLGKKSGKIRMSFMGVTKTVKDNAISIRNAVLEYGKMEGVAGSMAKELNTLDGLKASMHNKWQIFLADFGSQFDEIFMSLARYANKGLDTLIKYLPYMATWFSLLFKMIRPVITSLWNFIKALFNFKSTGSVLKTFGTVMSAVLVVVDLFCTGLAGLIDFLQPIAPILGVLAAAIWVVNIAMYANPVGLIIAAIVALIAIIGLVIKYTDGWGKSWIALKTLASNVWNQMKADFNMFVDTVIFGFNLITLKIKNVGATIAIFTSNLKEALSLAMSGDFEGAANKAREKITTPFDTEIEAEKKKQKSLYEKYKRETANRIQSSKKAIGEIEITVDLEGIKRDSNKVKDSFKALGQKGEENSFNWNKYAKDETPKNKNKGKDKKGAEGIISGGSKQTHITVNLGKLQDKTEIHVTNLKEGTQEIEDTIKEMLFRVLNSANQMQTS